MIVVTGRVRIRDGEQDALRTIAKPMCEASRKEPGCNAYRYGFDLEDDHAVMFHEEWASEEALASHFAEPHFATFTAALTGLLESGGEFTKWVGATATPLF